MNHLSKGCTDLHLTQLNLFQTSYPVSCLISLAGEKKKKVCLFKPSFINKIPKLCRITNQVHLMGDTLHFILRN